MKAQILGILIFCSLWSCQTKQQESFSIDSALHVKATSILESKLSELNAL